VLVDYGVDFDDLEAQEAAVVGEDFHGEMGFAVGGAATDGGADAGGVFGVDPVHVEGDVVAGGAAAGGAKGFFHDGAHAAFVDVAHGVDLGDAGAADVFRFGGVDVADADEDGVFRRDFGRVAKDVSQGLGSRPSRAARGMPWTFPEGEVSGVLMSEWASIQMTPIFMPWRW
jgi:hypothetical protein